MVNFENAKIKTKKKVWWSSRGGCKSRIEVIAKTSRWMGYGESW